MDLTGTTWTHQTTGTTVKVIDDLEPRLPVQSRWISVRGQNGGVTTHMHVRRLVETYDRVFEESPENPEPTPAKSFTDDLGRQWEWSVGSLGIWSWARILEDQK